MLGNYLFYFGEELLRGLELYQNERLTHAARVLFGRGQNYRQCLLRLARFRGMDKSDFLELRKPHRSVLRNPIISKVLYCAGLVEQWGRGTNQIINSCVAAKLNPPRFVANRTNFGVIIPTPIGITGEKVDTHMMPELSERKQEILRLLRASRRMSLAEMKQHFSVAERTLQDDLGQLKKLQQLDSQGRGRSAFWFLANNAEFIASARLTHQRTSLAS